MQLIFRSVIIIYPADSLATMHRDKRKTQSRATQGAIDGQQDQPVNVTIIEIQDKLLTAMNYGSASPTGHRLYLYLPHLPLLIPTLLVVVI